MSSTTSSALPPSSAWMKLACLSDTSAEPIRRPRSPASSMRRPALGPSPPSDGLTNTDPAFCPPGWCSRRQRTISAIRRSPSSRSPHSSPMVAESTTWSSARSDPRKRRPRSAARTCASMPRRRSKMRTCRSDAAMSEPWPPAFIRTAPPTEPGTPTAHSKPVSPAATLWRATTGSEACPPATTTGGAPCSGTARRSANGPSATASPRNPSSATSVLLPRPSTSTGTATRASARATAWRSSTPVARTNTAAGPPTR